MITSILGPTECRIWWADPRQPIGSRAAVLSEPEMARAARYHKDGDRRRFITGCWLLRTVAGAELGIEPATVTVDRTCAECGKPHGKPRVVTNTVPLHASISHSGNRVALAVNWIGPVGVDVEEVPPPGHGFPEFTLSPAEQEAVMRIAEGERDRAFLELWVRKEAVLKATGHGLRIPPDQVEVSGPLDKPALLGWPLDTPPDSVDIQSLDPGDGYVGAVALLADGEPVTVSEAKTPAAHLAGFSLLADQAA